MSATLFRCEFFVPCDVFNCTNEANWYVGRQDGPLAATFKLCDECAKQMLVNVPKELRDALKQKPEKQQEGEAKPELTVVAREDKASEEEADVIETSGEEAQPKRWRRKRYG